MRESIYSSVKALAGIPLTSITANGITNGTAVDLAQVDLNFRVAELIVMTGTLTDGTYTVTVQESANGTTGWTNIPAARLQGTLTAITATQDNAVVEIGVNPDPGNARFIRAVVTAAAVTTGGTVSALWLLSSGTRAPVR
jgi:hypothetical protein